MFGLEGSDGTGWWKVSGSFDALRMTARTDYGFFPFDFAQGRDDDEEQIMATYEYNKIDNSRRA